MSGHEGAPFSRRTLAWLLGVGGGSLLLAFLLSAFPSELGEPESAGNDSYSWSALGHRAFAELLRQSGHPVRRLRSRHVAGVDSSVTVVLAEPQSSGGAAEDSALALRLERLSAHAAAIVLVLPKWSGVVALDHPSWVQQVRTVPAASFEQGAIARLAPRLEIVRRDSLHARCASDWGESYAVALGSAQLLRPEARLRPLVTCDSLLLAAEVITEATTKEGEPVGVGCPVYVVSDPDLLGNHGLATADHAALVTALLDRAVGAHAVAFDESEHGFQLESNLLAELLRFPLVLAFAQALLLAAFVVWAGLGRFGKPFAAVSVVGDKRALVDTTAGLLERTGQSWETLQLYYLHTLQAVGERYFVPGDLGEARLVARLAEIARARGIEQDVVEWGRTIARHRAAGGRPDLLIRLAVGLHRWREEMIHDH